MLQTGSAAIGMGVPGKMMRKVRKPTLPVSNCGCSSFSSSFDSALAELAPQHPSGSPALCAGAMPCSARPLPRPGPQPDFLRGHLEGQSLPTSKAKPTWKATAPQARLGWVNAKLAMLAMLATACQLSLLDLQWHSWTLPTASPQSSAAASPLDGISDGAFAACAGDFGHVKHCQNYIVACADFERPWSCSCGVSSDCADDGQGFSWRHEPCSHLLVRLLNCS
mmetsp:Transcript_26587/g.48106  ORF Transcript_26587/g.48106 Transcript_26587/m.48106 type:complete len:223 (+) Transcript_26587:1085-1753(+)